MSKYRYFLTLRPVSLGTQPNGFVEYESFDSRRFCPEIGHEAWGWVEYENPLDDKQVRDYDLVPAPMPPTFKTFRQQFGSRTQFSEMTGIPTRTIEAWEQGLRDPHKMAAEFLKAIADATGNSMDEVWKEF